jgi:hypothetical protein
MNQDLIKVIDTLGIAVWWIAGVLSMVVVLLVMIVKSLQEIVLGLRDIAAETAYLATIEEEDDDK